MERSSGGPAGVSSSRPRPLRPEEIAGAFRAPIEPVRIGPGYRLALLAVASAMLLLPVAYLGLAGLVAWGTLQHARHGHDRVADSSSFRLRALAYGGPIVAGVVVTLLLLKPLVARRGREEFVLELDPAAEPTLFQFVTRLCETVRAPVPRRIEVDLTANAAAGFQNGTAGFLTGRLTLRFGLLLARELSIRDFGGVLAHELGHFSQRGAMRVSFLIRTVHAWFARVVFERDAFDEGLEKSFSESHFVLVKLIVLLAIGSVWVTRGILWLFLAASHALCCVLLRQMEIDADRHEVRVAGSSSFQATLESIHVLDVPRTAYMARIVLAPRGCELPDDLPAAVSSLLSTGAEPLRAGVRSQLVSARTRAFDTHPSFRDRVRNAVAESAPGVLRLEGPASSLFSDFGATCRDATAGLYRHVLGRAAERIRLVPVEPAREERNADEGSEPALLRAFGSAVPELRALGPLALRPTVDRVDEASLCSHREVLLKSLDGAAARAAALSRARERLLLALRAQAIRDAGFQIPDDVRAPNPNSARAAFLSIAASLDPLFSLAASRIAMAMGFSLRSRRPEGERAGAAVLLPVFEAVDRTFEDVLALEEAHEMLGSLLSAYRHHPSRKTLFAEIRGRVAEIHAAVERLRARLGAIRDPFGDASPGASVFDRLMAADPVGGDPRRVHARAVRCVERYRALRRRILGRFALAAEQAERFLGLPPLPSPAEGDTHRTRPRDET
ncbi:MAG: M48 family metalloprotease [Planctomycetes bacterium]|nr:M48 family metalloprotease [Planctomycetota bacterium]